MRYKIEKISDDKFDGFHPNGYDEGFIAIGTLPLGEPTVGQELYFNRENYKMFRTSVVIEAMDSDGIFKTANSTYKLTEIGE